ncbi:MAG: hypothetical protein ACREPS_04280, partial [Rhodanobacteraceae bacterium]
MQRLAVMLCVWFLSAGCAVASAQSAETLQQRYAHIQDLNNAGYDLAHASPRNPARLRQAIDKLKQAQVAIVALQAELAVGTRIANEVSNRRDDNLLSQADANAQLGDKQAALDALDALTAHGVWTSQKHWLLSDKYLDSLQDEPRFKALLARFDAVASRWNADAF